MGKWFSRHKQDDCMLPSQDPLLGHVMQRIVHAEIGRDFDVTQKVLGTGYSGAVCLGVHKTTGQEVAIKHFSIRKLKAKQLTMLKNEVEVYLSVDHPNICRLLHAYEGRHDVWLVMELCGCELYSRLSKRKTYSERDAADVMRQMLQAVNYLHCRCVVHRDLKLENWMYAAADVDDRMKLIDFGFSRLLGSADETLDMPCGTLHYTSPEVLNRKYTSQCDNWSLGVICYMLLIGRPPFSGASNLILAKAIVRGELKKNDRWEALSDDARDFVSKLICKDVSVRMSATVALSHRWIADVGPAGGDIAANLDSDVLRSLRRFAQGSHLRRAALTVLAYSLTSRELQDLEQTFFAFDKSGRGTITLDQLKEVMDAHTDVSSQEVERIFNCFDVPKDEELQYTPFVAAMMATRVKFNEDKVRAAFEAFEVDHSGYISAEGLVKLYNAGLAKGGAAVDGESGGLTLEQANQWIREVDYKGNGLIDYDVFLAALMGRELFTLPFLDQADAPTVRVFEDSGRPRSSSDSAIGDAASSSASSRWRFQLASLVVDDGTCSQEEDRRVQTFSAGDAGRGAASIRNVACPVDEQYFT